MPREREFGQRLTQQRLELLCKRRSIDAFGLIELDLVHRFTLNDAPFLCIAGLWRAGEGNKPPSFTMLTTEPGADIKPYHNRQIVVLRPESWMDWLYLSKPEETLLMPLPEGSLSVETVRKGSDEPVRQTEHA